MHNIEQLTFKQFDDLLTSESEKITDSFIDSKCFQEFDARSNSLTFKDTTFDFHYNRHSFSDIEDLKKRYAYKDILPTLRNDIEKDINPYYNDNYVDCAIYFLTKGEVPPSYFSYMEHLWLYHFAYRVKKRSLYNNIKNTPSKEIFFKHLISKRIVESIESSKYTIGIIKTDLSLYEQEIIKKYKPLKDISLIQIKKYSNYTENLSSAQKELRVYLGDKYDLVNDIYKKISEKYQFE